MFWNKKTKPPLEVMELAEHCQLEAEALYRSGKYHCAEAVMETLRRNYFPDTPTSIVGTVSGFGGGSGAGCICGAVSGGTVAIGLLLQDKKASSHMTKELHTWFKEQYGATCCKIIRAGNDKGICPQLTGAVAGKISAMLGRKQETGGTP